MHCFFLASFFWMNIMSFDIWRTFSGEFMKRRAGSRSGVGRTFIKYSAYAWTLPVLIVVIAAAVDFWVAESLQNEILSRIRPLYGHNNMCWIAQGLSLFFFFTLPAAILISTNVVLLTLPHNGQGQSAAKQRFLTGFQFQGQQE
jgi:G protein-coupled receptor Mth (Methuselah protein)